MFLAPRSWFYIAKTVNFAVWAFPSFFLHDFILFGIDMHQNRSISLFKTLFDHFHFDPLVALKCYPHLISCHMHCALCCVYCAMCIVYCVRVNILCMCMLCIVYCVLQLCIAYCVLRIVYVNARIQCNRRRGHLLIWTCSKHAVD